MPVAPIVNRDSIDLQTAFLGARSRGRQAADADYINCPMDRTEYYAFVDALIAAERIPLRVMEAAISNGGSRRRILRGLPAGRGARRTRPRLAGVRARCAPLA